MLTTDDAVATLWLDFDTFTLLRLFQIESAVAQVRRTSAVEILVVRSARPGGFPTFDISTLRALRTESEAAEYATVGQRVFRAIAELPIPTVAFLEGPCVGPGFELALACDHRLAVPTPDSVLDFGELPTCWGGTSRLAKLVGKRTAARFGSTFPRPARRLGAVTDAFCQRRAKIELRAFLDRLLFHPRKARSTTDTVGEAEERKRFRAAIRDGLVFHDEPDLSPVNPIPDRPRRVACVGNGPLVSKIVGEFALRGVPATWVVPPKHRFPYSSELLPLDWKYAAFLPWHPLTRRRLEPKRGACPFATAVSGGRVTPLEAEQARARVTFAEAADDLAADLVVIDETDTNGAAFLERDLPARSVLLIPPTELEWVLPACARPGRVLGWDGRTLFAHAESADDAVATALAWLHGVGERARLENVADSPVAAGRFPLRGAAVAV